MQEVQLLLYEDEDCLIDPVSDARFRRRNKATITASFDTLNKDN